MSTLLGLFLIFAKLSLFSFGGGFVMVPIAMAELEANHWATAAELTDTVAIATMSPGAVGVNLAVALGYKAAGYEGAAAALAGMTIPITVLLILVALFFSKIYERPIVKSAFYGLRPVITGIILYAAVSLALKNNIILAATDQMMPSGCNIVFDSVHLFELKSLVIFLATFMLLARTKLPTIFFIVLSGIIGVVVF
jgi:Chromate transport protein ChrA